jgi:hypothetical protein
MSKSCRTHGGENRTGYKVLVGKQEGRLLGVFRLRWENSLRLDLKVWTEIICLRK